MKIKSEWKLLEAIARKIKTEGIKPPQGLVVSIGDDCAVFDIGGGKYGLLTTDISVEGVHFRRGMVSCADIGYKAMAGNISDIAAMGGTPLYGVVSFGIPEDFDEEDILAVYDGIIEAANSANVAIAGGDVSMAGALVINIALYGAVPGSRLVTRAKAAPGDVIYVTGATGDSKAGLEILLSGEIGRKMDFPGLISRHVRPSHRFDIVNEIINIFSPSAMIDISDGILSDLGHICEESGAGFVIYEEKISVSGELEKYTAEFGKNRFEYALTSGEEYELLFTSGKLLTDTMRVNINGIPVAPVGEIIENGFYISRNGKRETVQIIGYDHFNTGR